MRAEKTKIMTCVRDSAVAQDMESRVEPKLLVYNYLTWIRLSRRTSAIKEILLKDLGMLKTEFWWTSDWKASTSDMEPLLLALDPAILLI